MNNKEPNKSSNHEDADHAKTNSDEEPVSSQAEEADEKVDLGTLGFLSGNKKPKAEQ